MTRRRRTLRGVLCTRTACCYGAQGMLLQCAVLAPVQEQPKDWEQTLRGSGGGAGGAGGAGGGKEEESKLKSPGGGGKEGGGGFKSVKREKGEGDGAEVQNKPRSLQAVSGTELCHGAVSATRCPILTYALLLLPGPARSYDKPLSGTAESYAPTRPYALSGTDIACLLGQFKQGLSTGGGGWQVSSYALATQCPVLTYAVPTSVLRTCYAVPGTEVGYGATRRRMREGVPARGGKGYGPSYLPTISLRACYAMSMSGTDIAYACYAMSSTDAAPPVLTRWLLR
eukprot:3940529-Rhodomonas_salina.1